MPYQSLKGIRRTGGKAEGCDRGGRMMDFSILIATLRAKQWLTPLEKDILDTYHEWSKVPFNRNSAIKKITENNVKYPDIMMAISTMPTTESKPWFKASDEDVVSNLECQLGALAGKELEALKNGK
jgi:hypothetical protein